MSWTVWLATSPLAKFSIQYQRRWWKLLYSTILAGPTQASQSSPGGTGSGLCLPRLPRSLVGHAAGHVELADHALLELLHAFAHVGAGAVLRADLHHAAVLAGRFDHLAAFPDAPGGRLLDVDVLARLAGPDRLQRVPVVLRAETDGVDRLVVEQLALVGVGLQLQFGQLGVGLARPSPACSDRNRRSPRSPRCPTGRGRPGCRRANACGRPGRPVPRESARWRRAVPAGVWGN